MLPQMARFLFFFWMSSSPLCIYILHLLYSPIDEHLGCLHTLAVVNNVAVSIEMHP